MKFLSKIEKTAKNKKEKYCKRLQKCVYKCVILVIIRVGNVVREKFLFRIEE